MTFPPLPLGFPYPRRKPGERILHLGPYLREAMGGKVYKISLDGGYTCPNRDGTLGFGGCAYCGEGARGLIFRGSISRQIAAALASRREPIFFAYFQAFTSTYAPFPILKTHWDEALANPRIRGLVISTRPDCLEEETLRYLKALHERIPLWIEIGVESLSDSVLRRMNRCHTVEQSLKALHRLGEVGIPTVAHLIVGLPGDSWEELYEKLPLLLSTPIFGIKIHPFHVVEGAPLAELWRRGRLKLLTRDEYVEGVGRLLRMLPPYLVIHRLTGAGPGRKHLAPQWVIAPRLLLQQIEAWMETHEAFQGDAFPPFERVIKNRVMLEN